MKINVIGLGYIGLPTAAIFANSGVDVVGVDQNESVVQTINKGMIHIEEPGLADIITDVVANKKLVANVEPQKADVFIIAVPTPNSDDACLSCDLTYVMSAVESIIPVLQKGNVVIIESTIAPRTTEDYIKPLIEQSGLIIGEDVFLAHCPERVLPGQILQELVNNNRVIGGITKECAEKAADIYGVFVKGEIIKTEAKTAEMSKLMENTFRDVNIALANEFAKICCELSINTLDVIDIANKHPRVNIHSPGPGVGGHCLAVDPYFIYAKVPQTAKLIKMARDINGSMPKFVVDKVGELVNNDKSVKIAAFGVTYKPNVDDIRESPALKIIDELKNKGYNVCIHDPYVQSKDYLSFTDALKDAGLLLCLVGHDVFKSMDYKTVLQLMDKPMIFDVTGSLKADSAVEIINYGNLYNHLKTPIEQSE